MPLYFQIEAQVFEALETLKRRGMLREDVTFSGIQIEVVRDITHGDFSTNAAMVLAKQCGTNPRNLAEDIIEALQSSALFLQVDVAGPGFINMRLRPEVWARYFESMVANSADQFEVNVGHGQKVLVEFVSINPTGPIHVGHGRNAILGDTLARLLERTGHYVYREYLINDAGNQIRGLVLSVMARYRELYGQPLDLPDDGYVGDYVIVIAEALKMRDGDAWLAVTDETELLDGLRAFCVDACMIDIKKDLDALDIHFDNFHSEYEMHQAGDPLTIAVASLRDKGYVYQGTLPPPKGVDPDSYEAVELTLFKATAFGVAQDKPIYNRRGQPTYFGQDIAYHYEKLQRDGGQDQLITVIAQDQRGNFEPLIYAMQALTEREETLLPFYYAMVKTVRNGEPVKLSKRAGNIVALSDVVREVGPDAYRFSMLMRKAETELVFDLAKVVEKSMDNPVFYVQYAHARCCSLFRQAKALRSDLSLATLKNFDATLIGQNVPIALLHTLALYPQFLRQASVAREPHRLAYYAYDLAACFHNWYNDQRILEPDAEKEKVESFLMVVGAVQAILSDLLSIIAVAAPESM